MWVCDSCVFDPRLYASPSWLRGRGRNTQTRLRSQPYGSRSHSASPTTRSAKIRK